MTLLWQMSDLYWTYYVPLVGIKKVADCKIARCGQLAKGYCDCYYARVWYTNPVITLNP